METRDRDDMSSIKRTWTHQEGEIDKLIECKGGREGVCVWGGVGMELQNKASRSDNHPFLKAAGNLPSCHSECSFMQNAKVMKCNSS